MQISPVTHADPTPAADKTAPRSSGAQAATSRVVTASEVSTAIVQRANGDGDGKTGTAALNDGDAAAHAASASRRVDVTA